MITDDRLFTCHEDCQTSFFRSLGTAKLADISAVSIEPGREYCVLVSQVGAMEAGRAQGVLSLLTGAPTLPRSSPRTASCPSRPGSST